MLLLCSDLCLSVCLSKKFWTTEPLGLAYPLPLHEISETSSMLATTRTTRWQRIITRKVKEIIAAVMAKSVDKCAIEERNVIFLQEPSEVELGLGRLQFVVGTVRIAHERRYVHVAQLKKALNVARNVVPRPRSAIFDTEDQRLESQAVDQLDSPAIFLLVPPGRKLLLDPLPKLDRVTADLNSLPMVHGDKLKAERKSTGTIDPALVWRNRLLDLGHWCVLAF